MSSNVHIFENYTDISGFFNDFRLENLDVKCPATCRPMFSQRAIVQNLN